MCSAATDIGTGTYTVMSQLSAEVLGLELDQVEFRLGDTELPMSPMEGGSGLTAALGSAVQAACRGVIQAFLDTVADDPGSPLRGCRPGEVTVADGRVSVRRVGKFGVVSGCLVTEGSVRRNNPIRVLRDNVVIFEGALESLRRFKDDVNEVRAGTECGIGVKNYQDVRVNDQIECFARVEVTRTIQ